jgi:peptidoglycan hydrolase-like protein with peptidoglycan-binding domain
LLADEPPLVVDGSYGIKTFRAVKAFQTAAGITVDGFAGPQTFAAIEQELDRQRSASATP